MTRYLDGAVDARKARLGRLRTEAWRESRDSR